MGPVGKSVNSRVYKIKGICFLPLKLEIPGEVKPLLSGIRGVVEQGMYFSYNYDLTNTVERASYSVQGMSLYDRAEREYMWNRNVCKDFIRARIDTNWIIPVIQGFVGVIEEEMEGKKVRLALISRRSVKRAGTRYNVRGIDDEGNVANAVETEQILNFDSTTYSFNQIRGTVPVFWKQTGVFADVSLTRSPQMAFLPFTKHFDNLISSYKRVIIFNLLSTTKEGEVKLTRAFEMNEAEYEKKSSSNMRYCHFDFHAEFATAVSIGASIEIRGGRRVRCEVGSDACLPAVLPGCAAQKRAAGSGEDQLSR
eukprot:TRINITY_DN10585_c0_g1_i16.p1 TRINITY_DN10585_c0_g1~~TRINITY_DN10585_c0_g1_i16.p1  ORF type:complete len:310 (+),score=56.35 TRINITY_DN10585_c0_g1_i16:188-1117(+)